MLRRKSLRGRRGGSHCASDLSVLPPVLPSLPPCHLLSPSPSQFLVLVVDLLDSLLLLSFFFNMPPARRRHPPRPGMKLKLKYSMASGRGCTTRFLIQLYETPLRGRTATLYCLAVSPRDATTQRRVIFDLSSSSRLPSPPLPPPP